MLDRPKPYEMLTDFVTGAEVPNIGAEENRQRVERFLVENKGYSKEDIEVDVDLSYTLDDDLVCSHVDLVVRVQGVRFMVIRCVAGSLVSRHREVLASARLLDAYQIPFSVVTDGKDADVLDTITGKVIGRGMATIPSQEEAAERVNEIEFQPFPQRRLDRERIIYRSYEGLNINVRRKLKRQ